MTRARMFATTSVRGIKGANHTTSYPLGGLQSKREKIANFSKDVEKLEPSYFAGGKEIWCSHLTK